MFFKHIIVGIGLGAICLACGPDETSGDAESSRESAKPEAVGEAGEDDLLVRLSSQLVANPATRAEKDANTIVDYAIENMLDVRPTSSGLYYQVIEPGRGEKIAWGDKVQVHYRGYFLDGQIFDASYRRGKPMEFYVGNVIDGWDEGLQLIAPEGKVFLVVPSELAYGQDGFYDADGKELVPPNKVLAFEVSVEKVVERASERE